MAQSSEQTQESGSQVAAGEDRGEADTVSGLHISAIKAGSRSKYRNVRTEIGGITFDSKREARRWQELQLLEKAGEIVDLQRQVAFKLVVGTVNVGVYRADFTYKARLAGVRWPLIVEDVKGVRTPVYRLKKRLMLACHNIEIREV